MKDEINRDEIIELNKSWHGLIFTMQRTGAELWKS